ncbi:MAG TPA: AI-2E family transporter [Terriglobales bacterium]|nr:AI-2E family transporter [Terriglobales bacterium]
MPTQSSPPREDAAEKPPLDAAPATEAPAETVASVATEDVEVIQASIKAASVAQMVVAFIAVLGLIYLLKIVMATTLASILLAFVLEPLVALQMRIRIPRSVGALIAVMLLIMLSLALTYFFYSRAVDFATELPKYSSKIRATLSELRQQTSKIEESTRSVMAPPKAGRQPVPVEVQEAPGLSHMISAGSTWGESLLAITFVPFLIYFMLTWKAHAHNATVRLFPKEHRLVAHRTVARISEMIKSFILGNVVVGVVGSLVGIVVFWWLHIPYFYFLGVISGFISLIPYLGVFLALLPPLAGGIGILNKTGLFIILGTVVALHVITVNVLYPKIVGRRLRLNPLAITLALLFWAWIWGGMGLILAVPIVGATKIVCDYVDPLRGFGAWLGE